MYDKIEFNLKQLLAILWKKAWIIILATIIFGGAASAITINFIKPVYTASVKLYVNNSTASNTTNITQGDISASKSLVDTYITIIQSDAVMDKVIAKLGLAYSTQNINGMMSTGAVNNTEVFRINISNENPEEAASIANAIADIAPNEISAIVKGSSVEIIDRAKTPTKATGPNLIRNTAIGALFGFVLIIATVLLVELLDTRIKTERDLKTISDLPILGTITEFSQVKKVR